MLDLEIREQIAAYLAGETSVGELEEWFEDVFWSSDLFARSADALAADALRLLTEFGNDDWTEDELKDKLGALNRTHWFEQAPKVLITGSTSSSMSTTLAAAGPIEVGTSPSVVHA